MAAQSAIVDGDDFVAEIGLITNLSLVERDETTADARLRYCRLSSSGETGAQIKAQFIGESGSGAADRPPRKFASFLISASQSLAVVVLLAVAVVVVVFFVWCVRCFPSSAAAAAAAVPSSPPLLLPHLGLVYLPSSTPYRIGRDRGTAPMRCRRPPRIT